ncbi:F0F1 ATP synthase subunit gamma [Arsenophonus symbiont of Ornithomya chloropus]|uniref:F0F1 ATP synthase subunit gamma n=1 Tax=Arsenophonus symbiont of Ornithomya chloropus TaxID=634121 RepID=UPI0032B1600B
MAIAKETRNKINSIKNTQKITKAMETVAVSKMRKIQERLLANRSYAKTMQRLISHLKLANLEYKHPYFKQREVKSIGYLVISTDHGLCGGLNINLFKKLLTDIKVNLEKNIKIKLALIGLQAISFFNTINCKIISKTANMEWQSLLLNIIKPTKILLDSYEKKNIDKLYLVTNKFVNTITQLPSIIQLLPLMKQNNQKIKKTVDYLYEPDSKTILDTVLFRYIESQVYNGLIENLASEQAARMVAMKSATDNCGNMIKELLLTYNKCRQSHITQELSEIIVGASAVQ